MKFDVSKLEWTRKPKHFSIDSDRIEIVTNPHTDLWQRTYYHFRNDNAPVLQMEISDNFFSFTVKTEFESKHRFDQCGIVMYLDSENWLKGSIEYENDKFPILSLEEYVDITSEQITRLKPSIIIHRLAADGVKDDLIAPKWTIKKLVVMNEIDKKMRKNNYYQGDLYV